MGNLKALKQMLPDEVHESTVVQHMPTLLLSNMSKVMLVNIMPCCCVLAIQLSLPNPSVAVPATDNVLVENHCV